MYRSNVIVFILLIISTLFIFTTCDGLGGFKLPSYTVVYSGNGGDGAMKPSTHTYGTTFYLHKNDFYLEGFSFIGWSESPTSEVKYVDEQSVKNLSKTEGATITLYAQWYGISYTVFYNANGGTGTMENSYFNYGVSNNLSPNIFINTGFNFAGWALTTDGLIEFENEATVENLSSIAGGTITLYAQWSGYSYTVIYNANGGTGTMMNSDFNYGISKNLSVNSFTCTGYVFIGWSLTENDSVLYEDEALVRDLTMIENDFVTLYAQWLPSYSVTFISNNGVPSPLSPINIPQGNKIPEPSSMTRTGYIFDGWYRESDFYNRWDFTIDIPTSNITLYAKWIAINYIVSYNSNASDVLGSTSNSNHEYDVDKTLTANGFSRTGYNFSGWSTTASGVVQFSNEQSVRNLGIVNGETVILYAQWQPISYSIIYNSNGGTGAMLNSTFLYGTSQSLRLNSFTNIGYLFSGWATTSDGLVIYTNGQSVNNLAVIDDESIILYAVWVENAINVPGTTLANKFTWLTGNAASNNAYIVEVSGDDSIANISLSYSGRSNIVIKIRGVGGMRTIQLSSINRMFTIGNSVTLVLDGNVTLKGISNNSNSLISIGNGGTLIMNQESIITENISSSEGAGVLVGASAGQPGIFIMNGGSITGNTSTQTQYTRSGGGVYLLAGTFTMNNGDISNNSSSSSGAGIYVMYGTFIMNGGIIFGNTISTSSSIATGGGVDINNDSKFFKTGGIIYGYTEGNSMSNTVKNTTGVVQNNRGHGIHASGYIGTVRRESDTGTEMNLSFDGNTPSNGGFWDGDWE